MKREITNKKTQEETIFFSFLSQRKYEPDSFLFLHSGSLILVVFDTVLQTESTNIFPCLPGNQTR
jgi:hypothetical protein